MKLPCDKCGRTLDTNRPTSAQQVIGWVVPRKGGGANHIRHQVATGKWMHVACLAETYDAAHQLQAPLF